MDIPTAGGPIPAAAIPALARAAADFAARHGDPSPVSITAVASRRGEAVPATGSIRSDVAAGIQASSARE
jgi:hypothetical protein